MKKLFDLAAQRHEDITKEAQLAASVLRGTYNTLKGLGGSVMRNPGKSIGAGLTAMTLAGDATSGAQLAAKGKNIGTFLVNQGGTF